MLVHSEVVWPRRTHCLRFDKKSASHGIAASSGLTCKLIKQLAGAHVDINLVQSFGVISSQKVSSYCASVSLGPPVLPVGDLLWIKS